MPDTQAADWIAIVGGLIGAAAAKWGRTRGEEAKKETPAPSPDFAGITATIVDRTVVVELRDAVRELTTELKLQRNDDETRRKIRMELQIEELTHSAEEALERERGRHPRGR